ncbi:hypothetical protein BMR08_02620 [Methylococcaceae bacterium CS2]|nr:hypothetical protein BMR10_03395 [Methylococcaceae bacterium CS4]TXL11793.1 hypothetical protein BMR08_02620 [Methylococcaceae bacterium CS2]
MAKTRFPSKIIPPKFQSVFERQRLFDLLTENLHRPLVWINGSPGAGKTLLVCSWLEKQQARFLWYRMDSGNNISADLFYFLSLSAQRNYPRKRFKLPVFTAECANDIKAFASVFFRQLFALLEKESALVFDDCQEIENDPDFFQVLQVALHELPEGLQIICVSRNKPAALFKRLSLTEDVLDINNKSLRFTEMESAAFINWLNPDIDAQVSTALYLKAEGWAAALVLLAQQKQLPETTENISTLLEQKDVFSFLMSEILSNLDETSLLFLTKTAIFSHFNVIMAIALTGEQNARDILDDLLNKNFLIDQTDDIPPAYCYQPLLRDLLQNRINSLFTEEQRVELNRSAISILIEHKKIEEAIPFYLQLQDWEGLRPLLLEYSETLISKGRQQAVIAWIQQFPGDMLANDPWLLFWYAKATISLDPNRSA